VDWILGFLSTYRLLLHREYWPGARPRGPRPGGSTSSRKLRVANQAPSWQSRVGNPGNPHQKTKTL